MAIKFRRGNYADFDPTKMQAGEPAAVLQNDPNAPDGEGIYVAISPGKVKRLAGAEELGDYNDQAQQILNQVIQQGNNIQTVYQSTVRKSNEASQSAQEAQQSAQAAAEVGDYARQAAEDVEQIEQYAETVGRVAEAAEDNIAEIRQAKTDAQAASTSASQSASSASQSASSASQSASAAASSSSSASTSESNAANSASAAASSASAAAGSASSASTSESNAENSATAAKNWAVGPSGTGSGTDTNNAKYYADIASAARNDASSFSYNASTSASAASTSATNAANSESAASSSASAAGRSETAAGNYATAAKAWAVGPSGTGSGTDTNNAKYWAEQAREAAGGGGGGTTTGLPTGSMSYEFGDGIISLTPNFTIAEEDITFRRIKQLWIFAVFETDSDVSIDTAELMSVHFDVDELFIISPSEFIINGLDDGSGVYVFTDGEPVIIHYNVYYEKFYIIKLADIGLGGGGGGVSLNDVDAYVGNYTSGSPTVTTGQLDANNDKIIVR